MSEHVKDVLEMCTSARASDRVALRTGKLDSILSASAKVFADEGYANFSSRRVASAAGIRLSTLQHYFGSRDNLLVATVNSTLGGYVQNYETFLRNGQSPAADRLEALLDAVIEDIQDPGICAFLFQAWALAAQDGAVSRLLARQYSGYLDVIASLVQQANPKMLQHEARVLAALIASQFEGLIIFVYRAGDHLPPLPSLVARLKSIWLGQCLTNA